MQTTSTTPRFVFNGSDGSPVQPLERFTTGILMSAVELLTYVASRPRPWRRRASALSVAR